MTEEAESHHNRDTLDEEAKPRTTAETDEQIEAQKAVRRTGKFPPETPDKDDDVAQFVERDSWDRLKVGKPDQKKET